MSEQPCACVFCGEAARIYETQFSIVCSNSNCPVKPKVYSGDLSVAITRWNARPQPACPHDYSKDSEGRWKCVGCGVYANEVLS